MDYTVSFGAFGGLGAKGFSLDAADFTVAPEAAVQELARLGMASFSDVKVAELEDIPEQPDGAQHQFLLTDPRQATDPSNPNSIGVGQDPAQVDRFQDYVLHAYQVASDAVQRVIDAVGVDEAGVPNSNIVITSDHGFAPFHTAVNMNNILANAGFDLNQVRAATSGPAVNIYINLKGREPNGTVEPSEYQALQQQVVSTLRGLQDENFIYASEEDIALFDKIYQRPIPSNPTAQDIINATSQFIGQDTGDVFALLSLGYNFDGFQPSVQRKGDEVLPGEQQPIFSVPSFYGAHGYDPNLPEMQASFLAIGPDFNANALSDLERVRSIDIAPTILDLLDVEPAPTVEGTSIFKQTGSNDFETALERLEDDVLGIVDDNPLLLSGVRDEIIDAFNFLGEIDPTAIKNILNLDSDRLLNVVDDWITLDQVINVANLATSLGQGSLLLGEEAINAISGISDLEASTAIEGMNARTSNFTLA
ncbi:alkaline phosphatase family protein [Trichocoleus sp. FACHB-262]|uniref:alkaline phosphatase family protein n=1 Tax=Trichocoleus sp. FACHB-262 TaxID=2692869 RepID=UPI0018F03630|nr:alkaline phosphatase family protein [Trichocoleus sp. FACHB-262]